MVLYDLVTDTSRVASSCAAHTLTARATTHDPGFFFVLQTSSCTASSSWILHVLYAIAASPTLPAQHWSTRAPRLPSPAATIDETIHLPPDALDWASTLISSVSNISILFISLQCCQSVISCSMHHVHQHRQPVRLRYGQGLVLVLWSYWC